MEVMRNGSETNICNLCRSLQSFQCADTASPCLRWSFSLSLSHCKFFLNLSLSSSLRGHLLQDDSATTHSQICRSYCYPSSAWECVSLKFIYTPSLYNFFNFSHLCFFEYVHFFPTIHKFWHLPPSTTNQPSLSLNFTWCQNKQLWI